MAGRSHTGIIDSEKMAKLAEEHLRRFRLQQAKDFQDKGRENNIYIIDKDTRTYADKVAQAGKRLDWKDFEKKLRTLPCGDNFVFLDIKGRPGWRGVMYRFPDGKLQTISGYGKTSLPEYSTIILKEKLERDFSVTYLNHLDMPKTEKTPEGFKTVDGSTKPGWIKTYESHGEDPNDPESRGWRTILLRIHAMGLATVDEIEKVFGRSEKKSWVQSTGKQSNLGYIL